MLALAGVYSLSRTETAVHLAAYRQIILDDLNARLGSAERVTESLAAALGSSSRPAAVSRALDSAAVANVESFETLAAVDASGNVVARYPSATAPLGVPEAALQRGAERAAAGSTLFVPDRANGRTDVWLVRSFAAGQHRMTLLAKMRQGFAQRLVDDVAKRGPNRAAAIVDGRDVLVAMGSDGPRLDLASLRYARRTETSGTTLQLRAPGVGDMNGYWARVTAAPGLDWCVIVAEPRAAAIARARGALLPAALVTIVALGVAVWASSVFARRVVEPLHQFEGRAREVASGYVASPLDVDRDDELGRLADAFNAMLVRLNALRELSGLLARSTRLEDALRGTLGATQRLLGIDVVPVVFLLDETGTSLDLSAAPDVAGLPVDVTLPVDGMSGPARALRVGEPIVFGGDEMAEADATEMRVLWDAGARTGLALRLAVGDEPLGVLVTLSWADRGFSEAEREMLQAFAAQAALAIGNSRLFEEEMQSRREAEALREVAEELESTPDLRASLDRVGGIASSLLGAPSASIALSAERAFGLSPLPDAPFEAWDRLFETVSAGGPHRPAVVPAGVAAGTGALRAGHGPVMLIPFIHGGQRRGMMAIECSAAAGGFSDRQLTLAATIGREVSLALENAYLLHQARSRAINLETIFRISQAVSSSLQSTVVLNRVLDVVQKIFSAEAVSLMTFDPAKRAIVTAMARGVPDRDMLYFETTPGVDLPGRVFGTGRAEVFRGLESIDTPLARVASQAGFHALLAVPLLARGRSTGVLSVYAAEADAFDAGDVELLQTFASQAALAIDTAQLYGREHRVSSILQSSILPDKLPRFDGLEVASVYRPAAKEAEIGGDYFDLFTAPDGRIVAVIADVAGKGVSAATKTSMIRYALRGMVAAGLGPGETLRELNTMVADSGDPSDIVTIWVGFLDIGGRTVTFADAGHPPALLLQPSERTVARLLPTGPVLGGIAGAEYREETARLDEGAMLMLYTDGVTEARSGGKFFGEGRIRRTLRAGGSAERAAERLMSAVDRFTGGALRDDAAVLVVRLT